MATFLRRDEVLPEGAVVVKGGKMASRRQVTSSAAACLAWTKKNADEAVHGVSVCSLPDKTAHEIASIVGTSRLPQTRMRQTTVGELRACGFDVVPSGQRGHATLILPDPLTDDDWKCLDGSFSEPEDNPVARSSK